MDISLRADPRTCYAVVDEENVWVSEDVYDLVVQPARVLIRGQVCLKRCGFDPRRKLRQLRNKGVRLGFRIR